MSAEKIVWDDGFEKYFHPGRGVGTPMETPSRVPSAGKLLRDVTKVAAKHQNFWTDLQAEGALAVALAEAIQTVAAPKTKVERSLDQEAILFFDAERPKYSGSQETYGHD